MSPNYPRARRTNTIHFRLIQSCTSTALSLLYLCFQLIFGLSSLRVLSAQTGERKKKERTRKERVPLWTISIIGLSHCDYLFFPSLTRSYSGYVRILKGKGREGKGREGKGREGKGREGKAGRKERKLQPFSWADGLSKK